MDTSSEDVDTGTAATEGLKAYTTTTAGRPWGGCGYAGTTSRSVRVNREIELHPAAAVVGSLNMKAASPRVKEP